MLGVRLLICQFSLWAWELSPLSYSWNCGNLHNNLLRELGSGMKIPTSQRRGLIGKQTYFHSFSQPVNIPRLTSDILTLNPMLFSLCFSCLLPGARNPKSRKFKQDNLTEKCYIDVFLENPNEWPLWNRLILTTAIPYQESSFEVCSVS